MKWVFGKYGSSWACQVTNDFEVVVFGWQETQDNFGGWATEDNHDRLATKWTARISPWGEKPLAAASLDQAKTEALTWLSECCAETSRKAKVLGLDSDSPSVYKRRLDGDRWVVYGPKVEIWFDSTDGEPFAISVEMALNTAYGLGHTFGRTAGK